MKSVLLQDGKIGPSQMVSTDRIVEKCMETGRMIKYGSLGRVGNVSSHHSNINRAFLCGFYGVGCSELSRTAVCATGCVRTVTVVEKAHHAH